MFKWAVILGAILGICGCANDDIANRSFAYQIQGISAYKGQDVADLFEANGAPNAVKRLDNNQIMWIYYTNYRPVGGGEIISYDNPPANKLGTSCMVRIVLENDIVQQIFTNCS